MSPSPVDWGASIPGDRLCISKATPAPAAPTMANPANPVRTVRRDTLRYGDRGGCGASGINAAVFFDDEGDSTESDSVVGVGEDTIGAVRRAAGSTGGPSWFERAIVSDGENGAPEGAGSPPTMTTG